MRSNRPAIQINQNAGEPVSSTVIQGRKGYMPGKINGLAYADWLALKLREASLRLKWTLWSMGKGYCHRHKRKLDYLDEVGTGREDTPRPWYFSHACERCMDEAEVYSATLRKYWEINSTGGRLRKGQCHGTPEFRGATKA